MKKFEHAYLIELSWALLSSSFHRMAPQAVLSCAFIPNSNTVIPFRMPHPSNIMHSRFLSFTGLLLPEMGKGMVQLKDGNRFWSV